MNDYPKFKERQDLRIKIKKKDYPTIKKMRVEGLSLREIGTYYGVSKELIRYITQPDVRNKKELYQKENYREFRNKKKSTETQQKYIKRKRHIQKKLLQEYDRVRVAEWRVLNTNKVNK